ncbi:MAG TPA: hypothetical protein VMJ35_05925 [Dongiaceae bacterium]|nr:hypothetical protein [Dongiaceae bacterium]
MSTVHTHSDNGNGVHANAAATASDDRRLDSWKEIAAYLNRSTRCAQRWEKQLNLPVHRIRHLEGYTVYAYVAELEAWRRSRDLFQLPDIPTPPAPPESCFSLVHSGARNIPVVNLYRVLPGSARSRTAGS